ncbi:hypothetical protein Q6D67_21505 [Haliea sp. E1-2-M8]|uniref:hypothetical protein n=1 Tax=Haliea sp. E1-2-M8 TaxID=3064706 RepID=UPI00271931E0|nr:hypothetical protein [Haliea sp. E1-2-M8]MDO8864252.1 hypothetical protein [Haliea sp. E1-2-M8]
MTTLAFDSLRFARKLRDAGMPEPQADAQAELMAEAFGFYTENILTKDHFEAVLEAKLDARFSQQDAKFEKRFADIDNLFSKQDRTLYLHTWMLGIVVLVMAVPQLQAWLA